MKILTSVCLVLAGMLCGASLRDHLTASPVHAQDQFSSLSGCLTAVPKSWGVFVGASTYGMAFEDEKGTLRLLQRPVCDTTGSASTAPTSAVDLQILRR